MQTHEMKISDAVSSAPALDSGQIRRRRLVKRASGEPLIIFSQLSVKRLFDLISSSLMILAGLPVFGLIAFVISCTSRGPVFFRQTRIGLRGKPFTILKFRTMHADNSETDHKQYIRYLLQQGIEAENKTEFIDKYVEHIGDKTTKAGRFLRATSMDELPQLFNILAGHMSLVGPRPHPVYEVSEYKSWYKRRLEVKPGLTGWSKLNLRLTPQNYEESMMYDIWYVDHWTLWLDLKIILKTIPFVLSTTDAH